MGKYLRGERLDGLNVTATIFDGHDAAQLAVGSYAYLDELSAWPWRCLILANGAGDPPVPHKRLPLIDGTGNDPARLQQVVLQIVAWWAAGHKVAVMCRAGANRSPAAAAAALYVAGHAHSIYNGLQWIQQQRCEVMDYGRTTWEFEKAVKCMTNVVIRSEFLAEYESLKHEA
jgi:hypothetical protein